MSSFVAQNVGARKEDRAKKAMRSGMIMGAGIGAVIAYLTYFHGDQLSLLFTSDPAVAQCSFEYLRGFTIEAVVTSISFSFMGYFNGHGCSLFVMLQGLAQSFWCGCPCPIL